MGNTGNAVTSNPSTSPSGIRTSNGYYGLSENDLRLLSSLRDELESGQIPVPTWGEINAASERRFYDQVRQALRPHVRAVVLEDAARRMTDALCGIGLLQQFLDEPDVEEIYIRHGEVAVERGGIVERNVIHAPDAYWEALIRRVADLRERGVSARYRAVLVDLPSGERFTGMLPPLTDAPAINIRRYGTKQLTLESLREKGAFTPQAASIGGSLSDIPDPQARQKVARLPEGSIERYLAWMIAARAGNILFAGEFSSGKTTLLNAVSAYFPHTAPVAVLETFRELQLPEDLFVLRAVAPSQLLPGQEKTATMDWVLNTVYTRTNPAAILLSEIVSPGEAMQFLMAANLGRRAYSTIHGATVQASLRRLEKLALQEQSEVGRETARELISSGVDMVVLMALNLRPDQVFRFIAEIDMVTGVDPGSGMYQLERLYSGWEGGTATGSRSKTTLRRAWREGIA